MKKLISKFLIKNYIERHKSDNIKYKVLNDGIRVYELWMDMTLFLALYLLCWFVIIVGIMIGVLYLTNVWLSILSFIVVSVSFIVVSIKIFKGIIKSVVSGLKEYYNLLNKETL